MATLTKILIMPFFGNLPEWWEKYETPKGYDFILDTDLEKFKIRVKEKLGIEYPGAYGNPKIWDYRPALGVLYEEEIRGFDFWGHTDPDCVYGDVGKWFTDEQLSELDIWSNHHSYVNGCWSLYRNTPAVNRLFQTYPFWAEKMIFPEPNGWVEQEFSRTLERSGLRYTYTFWQGDPYHPPFNLKKIDGRLFQDGKEIMMLHFRRDKRWPL